MITSELKDRILKFFCQSETMDGWFSVSDLADNFCVSENWIKAILNQFKNKGFIELEWTIDGCCIYKVTVDAHDYYSHGGFTGQDELLRKNIEKLLLEIEDLKPSFPAKAERFSAIIGGISAALGLIVRG